MVQGGSLWQAAWLVPARGLQIPPLSLPSLSSVATVPRPALHGCAFESPVSF